MTKAEADRTGKYQSKVVAGNTKAVDQSRRGNKWRGMAVLVSFFALTLPLMPVQAIFVKFFPGLARLFPHWYHRQVCRLIGVRLSVHGSIDRNRPVLLVANHTSWLDIPVLSAVAPLSFVAKREVGSWPFVSSLARLQRTVFVDRQRRLDVDKSTTEITRRLATGDTIVLFAEGTSSDGNRVMPFKTSLFASAKPPIKKHLDQTRVRAKTGQSQDRQSSTSDPVNAVVQTLSIVYTKLHGIPISRADRAHIGWYGDMEMQSHAWDLLKAGPLDVDIRISAPVPLNEYSDRKVLARASETLVRNNVVATLRGLRPGDHVAVTEPSNRSPSSQERSPGDSKPSKKWH